MMSLIKTKDIMLYVLIGLLVSGASQAADNPEEEVSLLKLRLNSLKNRYKLLCNEFADLATNCSADVTFRCNECPDSWFQVGDQCFLLSSDKQDWPKSESSCKEIDAHLAILTTREEHEALEKESRRLGTFYKFYWMGLTDIEQEGEWKWVDNTTLTTLPFWDRTKSEPEPDNNLSGGEEGEDCAVVDSHLQTWSDVPCTFLYPRICQKDANPL